MSEADKTEQPAKVQYISYVVIIVIILAASYFLYTKYIKNKNDESDSDSESEEEAPKNKNKKKKETFNIEEEVANLNKIQAQIITQLQSKNSFGRP
jgi:Tfp pilus assembly protein PilO